MNVTRISPILVAGFVPVLERPLPRPSEVSLENISDSAPGRLLDVYDAAKPTVLGPEERVLSQSSTDPILPVHQATGVFLALLRLVGLSSLALIFAVSGFNG